MYFYIIENEQDLLQAITSINSHTETFLGENKDVEHYILFNNEEEIIYNGSININTNVRITIEGNGCLLKVLGYIFLISKIGTNEVTNTFNIGYINNLNIKTTSETATNIISGFNLQNCILEGNKFEISSPNIDGCYIKATNGDISGKNIVIKGLEVQRIPLDERFHWMKVNLLDLTIENLGVTRVENKTSSPTYITNLSVSELELYTIEVLIEGSNIGNLDIAEVNPDLLEIVINNTTMNDINFINVANTSTKKDNAHKLNVVNSFIQGKISTNDSTKLLVNLFNNRINFPLFSLNPSTEIIRKSDADIERENLVIK